MKILKSLMVVFSFSFIFGCVTSGKYKACLSNVDLLKDDKSKLEQQVQLKDKEIATLKEKIAGLEKEKGILEDKISSLEKNLSDIKKENISLLNTLSSSKDELTRKVGEFQEKLKEKEEEKAKLEKQLVEKEDQIKNLKSEISSKNAQIDELKNEIKALSIDRAKILEEKEKAIAELKKTHDALVSELTEEIKKGEIEVTQLRDKLTLQMVEKILFDSGSAEIKSGGKKILDRVAEILKKVTDRQIRIEGHTDNVPIGPKIAKKYPTNWELSTARATNVVRYLAEKGGIDPKLLSAAGYAQYKPIDTNDTEEGRARNRRIEIVLIPLDLEATKVPVEK